MKNRIKELREQKRISQVCLATHIGCSQNTISKMELEMSEPKASQLLEMAKYFNVSVDYILCNSDYKYIDPVRPAGSTHCMVWRRNELWSGLFLLFFVF